MRKLVSLIVILAASVALTLPGTADAGVETLTVNTTADTFDGTCDAADCSLRDAVAVANTEINENLIELPAGTIEISSATEPDFGTFEIDTDITINGQGMDLTTISGKELATVFTVTQEGDFILRNVTVTLGVGLLAGGILAAGPLALDAVRVDLNANMALTAAGITATNTLTIEDSFVTGNLSPNGMGGIAAAGDTLIKGSVISDNAAISEGTAVGGLFAVGDVVVEDTNISNNRAMGRVGAGGIYSPRNAGSTPLGFPGEQEATLTTRRVVVSGNTFTTTGVPDSDLPAGGIAHGRVWTGTDMDITGNMLEEATPGIGTQGGGGISTSFESETTLSRAAITNNVAFSGAGGADLGGAAQLTNVTISRNETPAGAGGLRTFRQTAVVASTITNNTGGGDFGGIEVGAGILTNEDATFLGSIIDDNQPMNCGDAQVVQGGGGTLPTSLGYNIDNRESCGFDAVGDRSNIDPLLTPLHDNGGDAGSTHRLQADSPALDAWPTCPPPGLDQRKEGRPNGIACDIGAYELAEDDENPLRIWGDHDCSGTMGPPDVLLALEYEAQSIFDARPVPQGGGRPCPALGLDVAADASPEVAYWGDVDCDGVVAAMDILDLLYDLAGVMYQRTDGCAVLGEAITLR